MVKSLNHWLFHRIAPLRYPIWLVGGRIVIHSHKWADIILRNGYLVICWRKNNRYAFYSPDGTPNRALWGVGDFNRY